VTIEEAEKHLTRPEQKALLPAVTAYLAKKRRAEATKAATQCAVAVGAVALSCVVLQPLLQRLRR
jgi:crotonobetainyl-CoA:carnitine CoA-transferase CaiB-like acyl-CoA transferase